MVDLGHIFRFGVDFINFRTKSAESTKTARRKSDRDAPKPILCVIRAMSLDFQLDELNNDPHVHGIIVQMPLDCEEKIDSDLVTDYVSPEKDVDGLVDD